MRKVGHIILTLAILLPLFTLSQRKERKAYYRSDYNLEVTTLGVGNDGTKLIKVWGYGKKVPNAIIEGKRNAILVAIFRGFPAGGGANQTPPLYTKTYEENSAFFDAFLADGGPYLQFVNMSSESVPSGADNIKMKGAYKVGIIVSVAYDRLRQHLEQNNIIAKLGSTVAAASKPSVMVVPSDRYCIGNGYVTTFNGKQIPDYQKALQNDEILRLVISKMGTIMSDRGFPLKDLEQELKRIQNESAELDVLMSKTSMSGIAETPIDKLKRVAKADIILDLDFSVNKDGAQRYIIFNLKGLDAYTNTQVAGAAGQGKPSTSAQYALLLEEAVLSHMDRFNGQLQNHFQSMVTEGRAVTLSVRVWDNLGIDLSEMVTMDGESLEIADVVEEWLIENAVNSQFTIDNRSDSYLRINPCRIPLTYTRRGREVPMDTRRFATNLRNFLKQITGYDSQVYVRGLGEAWVILGEK